VSFVHEDAQFGRLLDIVARETSEDLDLMIEHGSARSLPKVANWTSTANGIRFS
jgi:hypothetical protein